MASLVCCSKKDFSWDLMSKTCCAVAGHAYRLAADPANTALERDQPRSFSGRTHHGHPDHEQPGAALQVKCSFVLWLSVINGISGGDVVCIFVYVSVCACVCVGVSVSVSVS